VGKNNALGVSASHTKKKNGERKMSDGKIVGGNMASPWWQKNDGLVKQ